MSLIDLSGLREKPGDLLKAINRSKASEIGFEKIQELFKHEGTFALGIKRGDQRIPIPIARLYVCLEARCFWRR